MIMKLMAGLGKKDCIRCANGQIFIINCKGEAIAIRFDNQ
jgi:hypothetical protein